MGSDSSVLDYLIVLCLLIEAAVILLFLLFLVVFFAKPAARAVVNFFVDLFDALTVIYIRIKGKI